MSTEFQRDSSGKSLTHFLKGSIEAGELSRAILDEMPMSAGVYASPAAKKLLNTKEKTCKPTKNPCCKSTADTKPACCDDKLKGTQTKTCKPTKNPCCKVAGKGDDKVKGTQTKTCKPTKNPCCKPTNDTKAACCGKKAQSRNEDYFGGAPAEILFI